eukprot:5413827-Prymnesium_polylepis.1
MAAKCFQMPETNALEFREHASTCHKTNRVLAPRPADEVLVSRVISHICPHVTHALWSTIVD